MALIRSVRGHTPILGKNCFLAENATVVGQVTMGDYSSVWFNAIVRGDVNSIFIGLETNIQDGAVIHGTYQKYHTEIGNRVSIAHNAIVHGAILEDNILVGMGAIIMDNVVIHSNSIIAAGAVVVEGTEIMSNSIFAGIPAKKIKETSSELINMHKKTVQNYLTYAKWYQNTMQ